MVHKKRIYTCQIPQPLQNEETTLKPKNWKVIYHESSYHLYYTFIPKFFMNGIIKRYLRGLCIAFSKIIKVKVKLKNCFKTPILWFDTGGHLNLMIFCLIDFPLTWCPIFSQKNIFSDVFMTSCKLGDKEHSTQYIKMGDFLYPCYAFLDIL